MADAFENALATIGAAIADVREKVVEEGWFGRSLSDVDTGPGFGSDTASETAQAAPALDGEVLSPEAPSGVGPPTPMLERGTVIDGEIISETSPNSFTEQLKAITQGSAAPESNAPGIDR